MELCGPSILERSLTIESDHIHLLLPFIHEGHVGKSRSWDELSNPQEGV